MKTNEKSQDEVTIRFYVDLKVFVHSLLRLVQCESKIPFNLMVPYESLNEQNFQMDITVPPTLADFPFFGVHSNTTKASLRSTFSSKLFEFDVSSAVFSAALKLRSLERSPIYSPLISDNVIGFSSQGNNKEPCAQAGGRIENLT